MSHAHRKLDALERARLAYLKHPIGLTDAELAALIDVSVSTACRYRNELPVQIVAHGRYRYTPTEQDVQIANLILKEAKHE